MKKIYLTYIFIIIVINSIFIAAGDKKIALYYPEKTIQLTTQNQTWLIDNYNRWELFLLQNKFDYEVIFSDDLENGLSNDFSVLILPAAKYLNEDEINSIKEFMNNGKSVLATSAIGVLNSDGTWKSWHNLEQLFGVKFASELVKTEYSRMHSIIGGQVFSINIPAGFRLQITTDDRPIEVKINSNSTKAIGYWLNNEIPFMGQDSNERTTSAVYGRYGKGNFVWFGFENSAVVGAKEHKQVSNQLFVNIISWLSGNVIFQLETWPDGKQSAAVISCDVEFKFNLINNALDLIERENLPAQFYILTESIDYPSFDRIKKIGSIGYHGDDHTLFKWQEYNEQLRRLKNGIGLLENLTQKKPTSFRPPETFYDEATLKAMEKAEMYVLSSDFIGDRAVPQWLENYPNILVIPKTGFDDYDIFYVKKIEDAALQSEIYTKDFLRTYEEGGLYTLNFHTQIQCRDEFIAALEKPIQTIKSKSAWITTHDSVYKWWLLKSNLKVQSKQIKENIYSVDLANINDEHVENLVFCVHKISTQNHNSVKVFINENLSDYEWDKAAGEYKIKLPTIRAGETLKLSIEF